MDGGAGVNELIDGRRRDVMVDDAGGEVVAATGRGGKESILTVGSTTPDAMEQALAAALAEWSSTHPLREIRGRSEFLT